ncbi:hypothetical protein RJ641_007029 [Dillenia turbinata]|uniref:Uncharacterized protein n=1 Tax=Dillenia turbinata TaxID=194707 RepID=A0AAN8VIT8_9MAGN
MEPPSGFLASLWNFILFLPYFIGLLLLGIIKGIIFCPLTCLIMTFGISAIILGLWPLHFFWTYYSILRAKILGPVLKLVLCICVSVVLVLWPIIGIISNILGGAAYGFFAPLIATFKAIGVGERRTVFIHCVSDGTWSTVKWSFTFIRDFKDVCHYSYFSVMDELGHKEPADGKYYEIRLLCLPGAIVAGVLGFLVDFPVISVVALYKSPYMLLKGWHRLFHDLIGREGPFLETICVPFAGLAILLWPLAVVGAVLGSIVSSIFLGAYAAVIVYQESSFWYGLCYIVASLAIYDEYSNDILDMREGSCFPRPCYRNKAAVSRTSSHGASFSRPNSFRTSDTGSIRGPILELKPMELLDSLFKECQHYGEEFVTEGLITPKDIEDSKSTNGGSRVISVGLPAYGILQTILRSVKANSSGILLSDNVTEITSSNRPKDKVVEWFYNPLLIIKEQIKGENLSEAEEDYLCKVVLLSGDLERLKNSNVAQPPESEIKRAELDALARRLQGITKSISRYPTYKRRFDSLVKTLLDELAKKNGGSQPSNRNQVIPRSRSAIIRIFSQRSFRSRTGINDSDPEFPQVGDRDVQID